MRRQIYLINCTRKGSSLLPTRYDALQLFPEKTKLPAFAGSPVIKESRRNLSNYSTGYMVIIQPMETTAETMAYSQPPLTRAF